MDSLGLNGHPNQTVTPRRLLMGIMANVEVEIENVDN